MRHSNLSEHTFKKGEFITPMNSLPMLKELDDETSWSFGRMPEYLWIGLILKFYGREDGLKKMFLITTKLHELAPKLCTLRLSEILSLDNNSQEKFFEHVIEICSKECLSPLTIYLTVSRSSLFAKYFSCSNHTIEYRCDYILKTMHLIMDHQSNNSTDIRFIALYFNILSGKLKIIEENAELLAMYPSLSHSDEIMKAIRPMIRSIEMMVLTLEKTNSDYIKSFWRCISEMTKCSLFSIQFPKENRNVTRYMGNLHEIFIYLSQLFVTVEPIDDKMNVLLGMATYSYKRLKEIVQHQLFNSISGRSCVRVLIENYIMMKYLVKNENAHENIWRDFQLYGIGLYKLVLARHRENESLNTSHFDEQYIELLVNEFKDEAFINMNTKYFDNQNIRGKAESVGEKNLYGLYYDYDSSFEHGLWGAIRESSLLKCNNPAHKYHCVPDIEDEIILKSVMPDCIMVMNKTLSFLNELYCIPEKLLNEVLNFEIESFDE